MKLNTPHPSRSRERALEDAVLPLINIVFLLMIFFLLAGKMSDRVNTEGAPQSWLSSATASAAPVRIQLLAKGELDAAGVRILDAGLLSESKHWGAVPVDVQAGADIPAARVLAVLNTLHSAGVGEVRLLTVRPQ